jgi:hypothetical protein
MERLNLKRLNKVQIKLHLDAANINRAWKNIREHNKTSVKKNLSKYDLKHTF